MSCGDWPIGIGWNWDNGWRTQNVHWLMARLAGAWGEALLVESPLEEFWPETARDLPADWGWENPEGPCTGRPHW